VLPDGTTVKQIGIRSAGAYSINLLLRDFEIPLGGKLFIYNEDHSYVIGSFDYRNNSAEKILPIQPVAGESIIIEYSEPADAPFAGHFTVAEVNHDYRNIFRVDEPQEDKVDKNKNNLFACMPDVFCSDATEETVRSTVLLIINGSVGCSGALINNTADDGKPYLLTAVHCLIDKPNSATQPFPVDKNTYIAKAGTIIAFFNYNRPVCDTTIKMKGSEEMSLAGASPRAIVANKDIALLEFKDSPPDYFNAYYAGWNRALTSSGKHTNLHHPSAAVKKYGMTVGNLSIATWNSLIFDSNSHWKVPYWTTGSTYGGSSGSPLFDEKNLIIGGLSGGKSTCNGTSPGGGEDYFFILGKGWETGNTDNQLKTYLDPNNTGVTQYSGKDPNKENPVIRLANAKYTNGDSLITSKLDSPNQGFVFGNSNLQTLEFAEEFAVTDSVEIFGTYLMIPAVQFANTSGVKIFVYSGNSSPEIKIDSAQLIPRYWNYSSSSGFYQTDKTTSSVPTETFVVFDKPVSAGKKFYISYQINYSTTAQFCVYNTKWSNASQTNKAWLKDATQGWVPANTYTPKKLNTSLAIQPLLRKKSDYRSIEKITPAGNTGFYYERSEHTLTLREPLDSQGQIFVYSIDGRLLEKIQTQPGQTAFILRERPKGTIGIVKITGNNVSSTGKIMY
jgi:hypothetical protein